MAVCGCMGTQSDRGQIAKAAGVTEPIIYRHFESKRELFIALIHRTSEATIRLWEHELAAAADPADRLKRLINANPMVANMGRGIYRVIVQAMTEVEDPKILEALSEHVKTLHAFLMREVQQAQDSGRVSKRFSPELTAWALIHMGLGYGVLSAVFLCVCVRRCSCSSRFAAAAATAFC